MKLAQTGKVKRGGRASGENITVCETQLSTGYCTIYLHSGLVYLHWIICCVALIAFYVPHKLHEHKQQYHIRQYIMWNVLSFFVRSLMRFLFCLVLFHFFSLSERSLLDPKWLFIWYNCMCHCGDFCTTNDDSDDNIGFFCHYSRCTLFCCWRRWWWNNRFAELKIRSINGSTHAPCEPTKLGIFFSMVGRLDTVHEMPWFMIEIQ